MSYNDEIPASESAEKRQPRQSRLVKGALESERFGRFDVTIRNVSQTGIGGQAPCALTRGERVAVHLPGHRPMMGTVRWVVDHRFGIETDDEIRVEQLRAAHGGGVPAADQSVEFRIIPPPKDVAKRPGLSLGAASPGNRYMSDWRARR
ncbi:PilZ domain-containing protein [Sphingopyxis sp. KK2]|uniref:PilZ domain-containing protein n=1 Tax=Sphingopyxis sp. KK2 TaxID=1855727 RepID=UPI00097E6981|nr:PilZ domain-containing protein [Sphingopyxis sp. KK2]